VAKQALSRNADDGALEAALAAAFDGLPHSAASLDRRGPTEVQDLLAVAAAVRASASACTPSPDFRAAGRARVLASIAVDEAAVRRAHALPPLRRSHAGISRIRLRLAPWLARTVAAALILSAAGAATASAAETALPGDALYPLKQAGEVLVLELARSEAARAERLVEQADTRLDEVVRLAEAGRSADSAEAAILYEQAMERAAATPPAPNVDDHLESNRDNHRARLEAVLATAPVPDGLERALAVTQPGRSRSAAAETLPQGQRSGTSPAEPKPGREPAPTFAVDQDLAVTDDARPGNNGLGRPQLGPSAEQVDSTQEAGRQAGGDSPPGQSSAAEKAVPARPSDQASPRFRQSERAVPSQKPGLPAQPPEPARKPETPPGRR
jgi:hypothetical protein